MRIALTLLFIARFAAAEESAYRWVQHLATSSSDAVIGIGTDAQGNSYIAGNTGSLNFPTLNAVQSQRGGAPLYRGSVAGVSEAKLYSPGTYVGSLAASGCVSGTVYASTDKELLRSTDMGANWSRTPLPAVGNGQIQVQIAAACQSGHDVVYVAADKLYRSADLKTWDAVVVGVTRSVYGLHVDPNDPRTLYASTDQGFVRSRDGGDTWKIQGGTVFNLSFVVGEPGLLYAPVFTYDAGTPYALAKSTDYGDTWKALGPLPGRDNRPNAVIRDPKRPNVLYATGLYVSEDSGQTWTFRDAGVATLDIDYASGTLIAMRGDYKSVLASTDGFLTTTTVISAGANFNTLAVSNGVVYANAGAASNTFVAKYSPTGELLYSTYFGGSAFDNVSAMTVDKTGAVYVTGATSSLDFPTTPGAYIRSTLRNSRFLYKLDSDGRLVFSTFVATPGESSTTYAIALAPDGGILLGGTSSGGLITTPGAYQPNFIGTFSLGLFFSVSPTNAFVQRFRADGSAIDFGTYLGADNVTGTGMSPGPDGSIYAIGNRAIFRLSADGATLFKKADINATDGPPVIAVNSAGIVYTMQRNTLARWTPDLQQTAQTTFTGTNFPHLSLDREGRPVLSGAAGPDLQTAAPLQGMFSSASGFVALFQPDLTPVVATYAGDSHRFVVNGAAGLADGGIVFTGATLPTYSNQTGLLIPDSADGIYVAALDLRAPPLRLDSIRNAASLVASQVAARETLVLTGGPFAADATVSTTVEGSTLAVPVNILARTSSSLTLELGATAPASGTLLWSVQSGGQTSNTVKMPLAAASPGIYSKDRSGTGQAVVFNKDGVANDAAHPAIEGDPITIFATGATPALQPYLYVGGFYANGIDAKLEPADGFPGVVYKLSVYMPPITELVFKNPDVKSYTLPPTLPIQLLMGGVASPLNVTISVKAR